MLCRLFLAYDEEGIRTSRYASLYDKQVGDFQIVRLNLRVYRREGESRPLRGTAKDIDRDFLGVPWICQ